MRARSGDANLDGKVDFSDRLIVTQHFARTDAFWKQGDFNYDGKVDFADVLKVGQNFGRTLQGRSLLPSPGGGFAGTAAGNARLCRQSSRTFALIHDGGAGVYRQWPGTQTQRCRSRR